MSKTSIPGTGLENIHKFLLGLITLDQLEENGHLEYRQARWGFAVCLHSVTQPWKPREDAQGAVGGFGKVGIFGEEADGPH